MRVSENEILDLEKKRTGTTITNNPEFEQNGYLILRNICDPEEIYSPVPKERGRICYINSKEYFHEEVDKDFPCEQGKSVISRYRPPFYNETWNKIKLEVEKVIGKKLLKTYYYDRFYFPNVELYRHVDRPACEISVSLHIGTNLDKPWPIWIKTPDTYNEDKTKKVSQGKNIAAILNPGDALLYKGCERPHWRNPMPEPTAKKWLFFKDKKRIDNCYYHQIFFHYVLSDGERVEYANENLLY